MNELTEQLIDNYIKKKNLDDQTKGLILDIAELYQEKYDFLFEIYKSMFNCIDYLEDEAGLVFCNKGNESYLEINERKVVMLTEDVKTLVIDLLDILEDTLPLGTVVDIRKDLFSDRDEIQELEYIRMIIIYRFMGDNDKYFFPYAGVVYPTGMLGSDDIYFFTRAMIDKIISRGYSDADEEHFVYVAKNELIIEEGMNSVGYAPTEDAKRIVREMKRGKING